MPRYTLNWRPWKTSALAGGFLAARDHGADHDHVCARRKRLDDVAGILDAAVRDDRDAVLRRDARRVVDRRDLRHADACNDTGGADGARADADLHAIRARVDQGLRAGCRRDVARDQRQVRERLLDLAHRVQDAAVVAVGRVERHHVHLRLDQLRHALQHVCG